MTIGQMLHNWLTKLDWFSTLFPRIPVPIQKQIETKINNYCRQHNVSFVNQTVNQAPAAEVEKRNEWQERSAERKRGGQDRSRERYDSRRGNETRPKEKDRGEHRHR